MALHDDPPHRSSISTLTTGTDLGGGVTHTFTTAQSDIPCSINAASSSEVERFARMQITVSHTVAYLASAMSVALAPGMKITNDRTSAAYHVHGIRSGEAYGSIPRFVYADVQELL